MAPARTLSDFLDRDQRPLCEMSELFGCEELLRASDDGCLQARAICFLFKLERVPFSGNFADRLVIVRAAKEGESPSFSLGIDVQQLYPARIAGRIHVRGGRKDLSGRWERTAQTRSATPIFDRRTDTACGEPGADQWKDPGLCQFCSSDVQRSQPLWPSIHCGHRRERQGLLMIGSFP